MNNYIWGAVIVIVLVAGYFLVTAGASVPGLGTVATTTPATTDDTSTTGTPTKTPTGTKPAPTTELPAPVGLGTGTLTNLFLRAGTYTCTFDYHDQTGRSYGAIFSSGGKRHGDFIFDNAKSGKSTSAHTITIGGTVYTWVDGMTAGFKTPLSATLKIPSSVAAAGFVAENNPGVAWDCHPWIVDQKQFAIPSSISFING